MTMDQPETTTTDRILSTVQVASWVGVTENTLRYWRWDGRGPRWFRLGAKTVKYKASDVQDWLDQKYADVNDPEPAA